MAAAASGTAVVVSSGELRPEYAIAVWLDAKANRSGSRKTHEAYASAVQSFRAELQRHDLDVTSDPSRVALVAQRWAGARLDGRTGAEIAPATYNQRLAILSSFYAFARNRKLLVLAENPIEQVERRKAQTYAAAAPLEAEVVRASLAAIDRSTPLGMRDYALLAVALATGRRASELAGLRLSDLTPLSDGRLAVLWRRCKGGKVMRDELPVATSAAVLCYLQAVHGDDLPRQGAETPVWLSHMGRALAGGSREKGITTHAIRDLCLRRIGTSKVHATRHTFAVLMEDAGAKVSDIQARLGHSDLGTTGRYLAALTRGKNPHAATLEHMLGVGV